MFDYTALLERFDSHSESEILKFLNHNHYKYDASHVMELAAKFGMTKVMAKMLKGGVNMYDLNWYMGYACLHNHLPIVKILISKGAYDWDLGLARACEANHVEIVDYMISWGANDWDRGMASACYGGHQKLIDRMISKGANDWNWAVRTAITSNRPDIVNQMIKLGAEVDRVFYGGPCSKRTMYDVVCRHYDRIKDKRLIPPGTMNKIRADCLDALQDVFTSPDIPRHILKFVFD